MESRPRRVLTRCLLRPADVRPQFEGFEVIGTFNPAAIECGDEKAFLVRVFLPRLDLSLTSKEELLLLCVKCIMGSCSLTSSWLQR